MFTYLLSVVHAINTTTNTSNVENSVRPLFVPHNVSHILFDYSVSHLLFLRLFVTD